jgi:Cu/Ag efflux pump CusA
VMPLAISTGAGANGRHAIGTGVMGGMIAATVLAVFFVPVFYVVIRRIFPGLGNKGGHKPAANEEDQHE